MGKFQEAIGHLVDAGYGRGMDGQKIARRLIEAGLKMMLDEGDISHGNRIALDGFDGSFFITTFRPADGPQEPQESDSGLPGAETPAGRAVTLTDSPDRAEVVAWIDMKIEGCAKNGMEDAASVLRAMRDEIAQHLESRKLDVAEALGMFYRDVHGRNVKAGWWNDLATGQPKKRSVGELFVLFVTELAEAYDAYLSGEADDKLPEYPGLGVELGDLQIRLADFAGALMEGNVVAYSDVRNPGDAMFREIVEIAKRYEAIRKSPEAVGEPELGDPIPAQDVPAMIVAKLDFNSTRKDHQLSERRKSDGKRT